MEYARKLQEEIFNKLSDVVMEYGLKGATRITSIKREDNQKTKVVSVAGTEKIKIAPIRRESDAICEVQVGYAITLPMEYTDITHFGGTTNGIEIRIEDIPDTLEFFPSGFDRETKLENGDVIWNFDRPYIEGQHVRIWWFKTKD